MNGTRRSHRWSALLLMAMTILPFGWSVSQPMPQNVALLTSTLADPKPYSTTTAVTAATQNADTDEDFIDSQRFRRSSARTPATEQSNRKIGFVVPGRAIRLDPTSPLSVPPTGRIEFVVTLTNIQTDNWRVIGELHVTKGDGTSEKLFGPRSIRLGRAQKIQLPVGFSANPHRFPPGPTQFIATLRDQAGQVIDQATVTFTIELGR